MIVAGVEEAGRGPVIGPMVMAIAACAEKDLARLLEAGVKDSKMLSPRQREIIFKKIIEICDYRIIILQPSDIDAALNDPNMNLNKLEAYTSAKLINMVDADKVTLDCPSTNTSAYAATVQGKVDREVAILAEHKADVNHVVVGAASILAKVTRDAEIEKIKKEIGIDFGSGYPSDPNTVKFLKMNWKTHEKIFRKTWATYKNVAQTGKQKTLGGF